MNCSAEDAVKYIKSGDAVFIHTGAAIPAALVHAMARRSSELRGVNIYQLHTEGEAPYAQPECSDAFKINAFFVGKSTRDAVQSDRGSYIPIFLSEIPNLFRNGHIRLDIALISVSTPDIHGYCSLGPSVDISLDAMKNAKLVIAQVNEFMPRSHGDGLIHISDIGITIHVDQALPETICPDDSEIDNAIGQRIVELIDDGSTLQLGIGSIPNAVLKALHHHRDLGIHSEMFSDGILSLVQSGVITGNQKQEKRGLIIGSFAIGTKKLYDFIDDNPVVQMMNSSYVNDASVISRNRKMIAINSAIEIDITGQVCADSIGSAIHSGVGGQMDFIRGSSLSEGGKPIIAMSSVTKTGESKLVPYLKKGAGVVTTRAHVHWVVTEFGAVNLYGKSIEERAKLLIGIAHPRHQEMLKREVALMKN